MMVNFIYYGKERYSMDKEDFLLGGANDIKHELLPCPSRGSGYRISDNNYEQCRYCEFHGRQFPQKDKSLIYEPTEYPCWTWKAIVAPYCICDYFQIENRIIIDYLNQRR
jgi:hypothetical protein